MLPALQYFSEAPPKVTRQVSKALPVKVSKTSGLYETCFKSETGSLIRDSTCCSPAKQFRSPSPSKPQPIPMSQRHSPPPNIATSRLPAPATKIQLRYLQDAQSTAPARKSEDMTCSVMLMSSAKCAPHHTFGIISTRSQHTPIHESHHFS